MHAIHLYNTKNYISLDISLSETFFKGEKTSIERLNSTLLSISLRSFSPDIPQPEAVCCFLIAKHLSKRSRNKNRKSKLQLIMWSQEKEKLDKSMMMERSVKIQMKMKTLTLNNLEKLFNPLFQKKITPTTNHLQI